MFYMPHGITVDPDNNIWITDVGLHQVRRVVYLTIQGRQIYLWYKNPSITDISIWTAGRMYNVHAHMYMYINQALGCYCAENNMAHKGKPQKMLLLMAGPLRGGGGGERGGA